MGSPAPLNTWLAQAICAYRAGRSRPVTMSAGPSGELFRSLAQAHIRARLADDDYGHYIAVRDLSRQAVNAARAGDPARAESLFSKAESLLRDRRLPAEPQLLSRSWIDQAYAYLAARRRDWPQSRERLAAAMQADLALEAQFGYEIFHIGRVHTLHLWLRTEGYAGNRAQAIDLAQAIVEYVDGRRDSLPVGTGWSRARAAAVPADLRDAMMARIASEAGTLIASCTPSEGRQLLERFPAWRQFEGHARLDEIHAWGGAREAFGAGDTAAFLEQAVPMLARGRGETTLWYATALDLCRAADALRPSAARLLREEVAADARTWRSLATDVQPAPALAALLAGNAAADPERHYRHQPRPRRFHVCSVGLPRTGTSSLYSLFAGYRTGNEFMERESITRWVEYRRGTLSSDELDAYILRRDDEGGLEMDSASFHHLYLNRLAALFPDARFIFTIRTPYEWANSYVRMLLNWRERFGAPGVTPPQWMADYGSMLFDGFSWDAVGSRAAVKAHLRPLADMFVRHWAEANRRTLALLPPERSLVIPTGDLSRRREGIARFVGIPVEALTGRIHTNASEDRTDLLQSLGRHWVEERAAHYGADVVTAAGLPASAPAGSVQS